MTLNLRPHQEKALGRLGNGKILWGDVGSGKSRVAVAYYESKEAPRDVYVITTARKRDSLDWEKDFARIAVGKTPDTTVAGLLRVDSYNNLGKYRDVEGAFFIFDEQRLVGSGQWVDVFLKIAKKNHWIMLSATPGDTWMDYIPVFVANGFYKHRTQFKRDHVVYNTFTKFPKVDRYIGTGKLQRLRNELLVEMPFVRNTRRETIVIPVDYDQSLFEKVMKHRWNPFEDQPIRDVAELFRAMRRVVNSDTSRLEAVRQLLEKHPRLIVFYNFNYELEALRSLSGQETPSPSLTVETLSAKEEDGKWQTQKPVDTGSLPQDSIASKTPLTSFASAVELTSPVWNSLSNGRDSTSTTSSGTSGSTSQLSERTKNLEPLSKPSDQLSTSLVVAEWNGHKHQPVPESERWLYLVQFAAGAEAWNCITTDAMCFYSLPYSYKFWHQAHGRIDRMDTLFPILWYYVLKSRSLIDLEVAKSLANKQDFNESRFIASRARVDASGQGG